MNLDVIFATVVGVLAGLAVIGALAFALVWEWCAIRRTLANLDSREAGMSPPFVLRAGAGWHPSCSGECLVFSRI